MKLLITGGAGYIGTELVRTLADEPGVDEIIVYDNLSRRAHGLFLGPPLGPVPLRFVRGDLLDTRSLRKAAAGVDVIVHLAARVTTPFADGDAHSFEQVNHWGTAELGHVAATTGVRRLIYLSSTSVYGDSGGGVATLDTVPDPRTAYGVSKLAGERALAPYGDSGELLIVRCANVYGFSPSLRFDAVVNRMVFDARFAGRITQEGSGRQGRAFASVDGVARTLARLARGEGEPGLTHLVERNLTIGEVSAAVAEVVPGIDTLYVAQDLPRRQLRVSSDPRLTPKGDRGLDGFTDELRAFLGRFAFGG